MEHMSWESAEDCSNDFGLEAPLGGRHHRHLVKALCYRDLVNGQTSDLQAFGQSDLLQAFHQTSLQQTLRKIQMSMGEGIPQGVLVPGKR